LPAFSTFAKAYKAELPSVAATLTTTLIIFLVSLLFEPVRTFLFPSVASDYSILCVFNKRPDPTRKFLIVEGYVINRTDDTKFAADLQKELLAQAKDGAVAPTITLKYDLPVGRIDTAEADDTFNADRGTLEVERIDDKTVVLTVRRIEPFTILKANVVVSGREDNLAAITPDTTSGLVMPLAVRKFQEEACHDH
jgi:hypothetical protein